MPEITEHNYKDDQKAARAAVRKATPIWNGGTAHLGIKEFKRRNKGNNKMINTFKQNFWNSIKQHNKDSEENQNDTQPEQRP